MSIAQQAPSWNWPGEHSALDPAGRQGELFQLLWWPMLGVAVVSGMLVLALLWMALRRRSGSEPSDRARWRMVMLAGVALPAVSVVALVLGSVLVDVRSPAVSEAEAAASGSVTVDVTAHMWWWEVEYVLADGTRVADANQIRVPVDEPIRLRVRSDDVIHSLWVPSLGTKVDAVPGHDNEVSLHATREGVFRGVCAELCGTQHAHMAFQVVAEPSRDFEQWLQRRAGRTANDDADADVDGDSVARGAETFLQMCAACHTVAGSQARGVLGPDLTHLGSRLTIAAGALRNNRGNLAGWILDPQNVKPGSQMPPQDVPPDDLEPLLDYLESLE